MSIFNIISYIIIIGIIISGFALLINFYFGNFPKFETKLKNKKLDIEDIDNKVFQLEAYVKALLEMLKDHCGRLDKIKLTLEEHETLLLDYQKINDMNKRIAKLEKIIKQGE